MKKKTFSKPRPAKGSRPTSSRAPARKRLHLNPPQFCLALDLEDRIRLTRRLSSLGEVGLRIGRWRNLSRLWGALVAEHDVSAPEKLLELVAILVQATDIDLPAMGERAKQRRPDAESVRAAAETLMKYPVELIEAMQEVGYRSEGDHSWRASQGTSFEEWPGDSNPVVIDVLVETARRIETADSTFKVMNVSEQNVAQRGGGRSKTGRARGFLVREVYGRIPASLKCPSGYPYALIVELLAIAGIPSTRQWVRGIIRKGKT